MNKNRSNSSLRIGHLDELGFFVNDTDAEIDHDICNFSPLICSFSFSFSFLFSSTISK